MLVDVDGNCSKQPEVIVVLQYPSSRQNAKSIEGTRIFIYCGWTNARKTQTVSAENNIYRSREVKIRDYW